MILTYRPNGAERQYDILCLVDNAKQPAFSGRVRVA